MFNNLLSLDGEFIIFFIVEIILILGYFIFVRYSRNNEGVFDRRVDERRLQVNRVKMRTVDRRILDMGFGSIKMELAGTNERFEVDTDRRIRERREFIDRRNI
jgi:hypothetical protein